MKRIIQVLFFILISNISFGQTKNELIQQVKELKMEIQSYEDKLLQANNKTLILETKLKSIESILLGNSDGFKTSQNNVITSVSNTDSIKSSNNTKANDVAPQKRCMAITATGTQCSRNASSGSDYCWQHQNNQTTTSKKSTSSNGTSVDSKGRTIYTGPSGGKYYINSNGNKTYIK